MDRPGRAAPGHGVQLQQQLAHHRHRRHLARFAPPAQLLIKPFRSYRSPDGGQCRRVKRTALPRPRWPRYPLCFPLSRDQGVSLASEHIPLPSPQPISGKSAARVAAVSSPTPGTLRYSCARCDSAPPLCRASRYS